MIIVMPNAHNSFYTDMLHGFRYFTYIAEELPSVLQTVLPVSDRREDTYVCGGSMGGYGAFKLALTHPDRYAAAASISGPLDMAERVKQRMPVFDLVFGRETELRGTEHDLLHLSSRLMESGTPIPRLYQTCGTEDHLFRYNESFHTHAKHINLPLTYTAEPGGHDWSYFDRKLEDIFHWMFPL
jgi:putative tributyrin esterase